MQGMIKIVRDKSDNKDFQGLVRLLDEELYLRYGEGQAQFDKYNKTDNIDTAVIGYFNDSPVGCGCFKHFNQASIEIKRMFVKSECRGSGIAEMILRELEKWANEMGYSDSMLETAIKQPEAIKFYTRLGYKQIENWGQYIGKPDHLCMCKKLTV